MALVDEIELFAQSGKGGDGVVRWLRTRSISKGGPAGGNGGRGGDVIIRAVRDAARLGKYRGNTNFKAGDGEAGGGNSLYGHNGADVTIELPIGSVVTVHVNKEDETSKEVPDEIYELLTEGEEYTILKGGNGGYGNEHFKSSRNVTPEESTKGKPGISATLYIELKLIADLGLVGYPNAGKSSLLNAVTNAHSKVGDYAFTTLEPHLGELFGYIIADIPGIIEGASEGKGLGHKFLKHIARTKALLFCISVEQDEPISVYRALLSELLSHDSRLGEIPAVIVLTKTDLIDEGDVAKKVSELSTVSKNILTLSILDDESIKVFIDEIMKFVRTLE